MFKAARGAKRARPFAPWRIVVWLVMLLAAGGFVVNTYAAVILANAVGATTPDAAATGPDPRFALVWAVAYLLVAFATMAVALATLRWHEWARRVMRVLAWLLMVWAACTAWFAYAQWQQIGVVLGQPGLPSDLLTAIGRQRTILLVGLMLKAVSVPVLAWLAWALGSMRVRQQFALPAL